MSVGFSGQVYLSATAPPATFGCRLADRFSAASMMRTKVPQRQMLPSRPFFACSSVGFGCFSSSATVAITKPGVQKPHIRPSVSKKACCTGCSVVAVGQAVDGANLLALHLDGERRAGVDRAAVDDHRAGAAGAAIADALVAGEVGAVAQRVEQRDARLDPQIERACR